MLSADDSRKISYDYSDSPKVIVVSSLAQMTSEFQIQPVPFEYMDSEESFEM